MGSKQEGKGNFKQRIGCAKALGLERRQDQKTVRRSMELGLGDLRSCSRLPSLNPSSSYFLPYPFIVSHTDPPFCSFNLPSSLQPQGLCTCCPLCLECPSPLLDSRPALLILQISVQCHLFREALLHLISKGGTSSRSRQSLTSRPSFFPCHRPFYTLMLYIYLCVFMTCLLPLECIFQKA